MLKSLGAAAAVALLVGSHHFVRVRTEAVSPSAPAHIGVKVQHANTSSCFLLIELGKGEQVRRPNESCRERVTPASTFKVAHALAALDAGVVSGPDEAMEWDGNGNWAESARRTHTLASAIRNSVVWYFQRVAERLGEARERDYLHRFAYGNMDASSGLTTFWLGQSLQISPEEQARFLVRLFTDSLPVSRHAMTTVRDMMREPQGLVVNAAGEHAFDAPWPDDAIVRAKPGSATDHSGKSVRWLVGLVERGARQFVFVSCVVGNSELAANAAIDLAARRLREEGIL